MQRVKEVRKLVRRVTRVQEVTRVEEVQRGEGVQSAGEKSAKG